MDDDRYALTPKALARTALIAIAVPVAVFLFLLLVLAAVYGGS